MKDELDNVC